ncbi:hypothetical protein LTR56_010713 [Elasticomyces elasticus]|nr:hypothetical protein LTR56_010713 [Elasticomyces elasticus]KAK3655353.1 hypothetical protein LTR22_010238 [Elasticomyces elasticus]KAK4922087.1 hypothetical protein LTR49_010498 [Elasticomyces elasticus]KAK5750978.1 hypothetical protein LTS12_018968 [Elasticomyces elasticus]
MAYNSEPRAALAMCALPRLSTEVLVASPSPTLLTIPVEMRNSIYELVFFTQPEKADLLDPAPPSKALLLTCREIYCETRGVYLTAYHRYWEETRFTVRMPLAARTEYTTSLTIEALRAVRHLQLTCTLQKYLHYFASLSEYIRYRGTELEFTVNYGRLADGRWVCTTANDIVAAGFTRPRVLLIRSNGTLHTIMPNANDLEIIKSYPQEAQNPVRRHPIRKRELERLLDCKLKLSEGER